MGDAGLATLRVSMRPGRATHADRELYTIAESIWQLLPYLDELLVGIVVISPSEVLCRRPVAPPVRVHVLVILLISYGSTYTHSWSSLVMQMMQIEQVEIRQSAAMKRLDRSSTGPQTRQHLFTQTHAP